MNQKIPEKKRPNCFACVNFYVTWEKQFPYGCRAMNFKSKKIPSLVVFESTGAECYAFVEKKRGDN
ncbi:MAG: uracil-DNA glycosylase [Deltaproteobacteria bacterium]|nr:uracil-DNA glycosylase [Deltaproteobacteria bacterium]